LLVVSDENENSQNADENSQRILAKKERMKMCFKL
jgi:hypothetical protein